MNSDPHQDAAHLEAFRGALALRLGLRVEDDRLPHLGRVLRARLHATGADPDGYLATTLASAGELSEVARHLAVSETYFFRNADHMRAFASILRERHASGQRSFRVLSAGCASGEEAYSLALLARETLGDEAAGKVAIHACDVSPDAIAKARAGRSSAWSLRQTPPAMQERYLPRDGAGYRVAPALAGSVHFEARNLVAPDPAFWRDEVFDVVFCRNVLMYFAPAAAREVVARIARALVPGGWLFLGDAETLRALARDDVGHEGDGRAELELRQREGAFCYRRRRADDLHPAPLRAAPIPRVEPAAEPAWHELIAQASVRVAALAQGPAEAAAATRAGEGDADAGPLERALELLGRERFAEALALLGPSRDGDDGGAGLDARLLRAVLLVQSGDVAGAEAACGELLRHDELEAGVHYLLALCREHQGDVPGATARLRVAARLDPAFAMPRFHLGLLARRAGDADEARRELELAQALFAQEDPARMRLFGGGFDRDALMAMCRAALARGGTA
ncbi:MAG: protein-glutamate O-methyltransferase CheR [Myxococcota bacterium]